MIKIENTIYNYQQLRRLCETCMNNEEVYEDITTKHWWSDIYDLIENEKETPNEMFTPSEIINLVYIYYTELLYSYIGNILKEVNK